MKKREDGEGTNLEDAGLQCVCGARGGLGGLLCHCGGGHDEGCLAEGEHHRYSTWSLGVRVVSRYSVL